MTAMDYRVNRIYVGGEAAGNRALDENRNALLGTVTASGRATLNGGILMNGGAGASSNNINVGSATSGVVNASFGFHVAGVGSMSASEGPYFAARGNAFSTISNQRGNIYLAAGVPSTPAAGEGLISITTASGGMIIKNTGFANFGVGIQIKDTQLVDASRNVSAAAVTATVLKLTPSADPPGSPSAGWVYMDTDNNIYVYNGTTWVQMNNAA